MRIVLPVIVVAGALAPIPAHAEPGEAARVAEELNDPVRQERLARTTEAVTTAVLDMPAAPLLRAAKTIAGDNPDHVDPDLRVGDLVDPIICGRRCAVRVCASPAADDGCARRSRRHARGDVA